MAVTIKKVVLWRHEVDNKPGMLVAALEPLATAGADLHIVMGYRYPGNESRAAIELYPVSGKKVTAAAKAAGLTVSSIPTLLVEGDNRAGLGATTARALADAGINLSFLVAQVIGRKYSALFGFETAQDASKAAALLKKATAPKKATPRKTKETHKRQPAHAPKVSIPVSQPDRMPGGAALQARPAMASS
jgi:hypothetical protein